MLSTVNSVCSIGFEIDAFELDSLDLVCHERDRIGQILRELFTIFGTISCELASDSISESVLRSARA